MAFWSANNASPIQQHHFTVEFGTFWEPFEVKSVTMPSIEIQEGQYRMGNHMYKYPGTQRWNDITITIVDSGDAVQRLKLQLTVQGLYQPDNPDGSGGGHRKFRKDNDTVVIRQNRTKTIAVPVAEEEEKTNGFLSFLGFSKKPDKSGPGYTMSDDPIMGGFHYGYNSWYLKGAWIKSVNFGTHDYSSDELVTMEIVVAYDYAKIITGGGDARRSMLANIGQLTNGLADPRDVRKAKRKEKREERKAKREEKKANKNKK